MSIKSIIKRIHPSYFLIAIFFIVNLLTLMRFPAVHSDELWLKGIADEMLHRKSFTVTEPFFDLYPRVIHPFRWLYNLILIGFFKFFGSSAFVMRLVSLTFGTLSLITFDQIIGRRFQASPYRTLGTLILALDIQFIYGSHLGRQETLILLLMLLGLLVVLSDKKASEPYFLALIVLLGMGIHPNSFILGVAFSSLLAYKVVTKAIPLSSILKFWGTTFLGIVIYATIGYFMNPTFVSGYLNYGSALGVDAPLMNRFEGFYWYWVKLYKQIGGTYDLMDIRIVLVLFVILTAYWTIRLLGRAVKGKPTHDVAFYPYLIAVSIAVSLLIIGRYNQTAVIFVVPPVILMTLEALFNHTHNNEHKSNRTAMVILILLALIWARNLYGNIDGYQRQRFYALDYDKMLETLKTFVPENSVVLSNLNTIEAFDSNQFYDVRNLGYLDESVDAFEAYIAERKIKYIILHEEMDYIARNADQWGFLYVDIHYYDAMMTFINEKARQVGSFENPIYAMRLSRYSGTFPWRTFIYEVLD